MSLLVGRNAALALAAAAESGGQIEIIRCDAGGGLLEPLASTGGPGKHGVALATARLLAPLQTTRAVLPRCRFRPQAGAGWRGAGVDAQPGIPVARHAVDDELAWDEHRQRRGLAQHSCIRRTLQRSAEARTTTPSRRAIAAGVPSGEAAGAPRRHRACSASAPRCSASGRRHHPTTGLGGATVNASDAALLLRPRA